VRYQSQRISRIGFDEDCRPGAAEKFGVKFSGILI
jgi:hypothetical protein